METFAELLQRRRAEIRDNEDGYLAEPNTTPMPNELLDTLLFALDDDELRVILYISRHTLGYKDKKAGDFLAVKQFVEGIKGQDLGCGISGSTRRAIEERIKKALNRLESMGYILVIRDVKISPTDKFPTKMYKLNVRKIKGDYESIKSERV